MSTIVLLDAVEARQLTEQIRTQMEGVWDLLLEAHEREAWRALGYDSWRVYAMSEFGVSKSHAYRLLDQARVITALTEVTGDSPMGEISERDARAIKPQLEEVLKHVRELVADGGDPAKAIEAAVTEARARAAATTRVTSDDDGPVADNDESKPPITKPDLGNGVSHPARYSDALMPVFVELLQTKGERVRTVLDPYAGTGRIHELRPAFETAGVEIEPEWADMSPHTIVGNIDDQVFEPESFDAVCTSCDYGNRLADSHNASDPHLRRSYTHDLGRPLTTGSTANVQWGDAYRERHEARWRRIVSWLKPGGLLVLNIKDHIREGDWQDVAGWHVGTLAALGLTVVAVRPVVTPSLKQGTNAEKRVCAELVIAFVKEYA